jgi:membrane fusion protein, multidrug efflux system
MNKINQALIRIGLLGLWFTTGTSTFADSISAEQGRAQVKNASQDERRIRTQLISPDAVVISSEIGGKIAELKLHEGDSFKRGDRLVGLDCSLYEAQFKKAQASNDSARKLQQVTARMASLNATGELELEQSAAKARESEAELNYMKTSMGKCQLAAPFDGRVARRMVAPHQFVAAGTPLLDIQSSTGLELQLIVPSHWLTWLKVGSNFSVSLEENAKTYPAQITRLGARIDPVSQTISITARILKDNQELLPGMSGWADFNNPSLPVAQTEVNDGKAQ